MTEPIRVGILGAQPGRSWAAVAHLPALRCLPGDFDVVAVANSTQASADAAAKSLAIPQAFAGIDALVACSDIDLVVITVKVPHHLETVSAALRAGKHVLCEWPLGNGLQEAVELEQLQARSGRLGIVGMQARVAPEILFARDLVAEGYVGDVLSTTVAGTCLNWSGRVDQANAYTQDYATGASMLTIPFGHLMSAMSLVLGDVKDLSAVLATRRQTAVVNETGEEIPIGVADQILMSGRLASSAPVSVHYRGDIPRGQGFSWLINGTEGAIEISGSGGNIQLVQLALSGAPGQDTDFASLPLPARFEADVKLPAVARNVHALYRMVAEDIRRGHQVSPGFSDAVRLHRLLDAVETAAETGRQSSLHF